MSSANHSFNTAEQAADIDVDTLGNGEFLEDVRNGLKQTPKQLPCKYFYDQRGSELFEAICETPEYYVTRTETELLRKIAPEISSRLGAQSELLEFGSGAGEKIRILLDELQSPSAYIPMDISREILMRSASELSKLYPDLSIRPWVGDYTTDLTENLNANIDTQSRRIVFFPGSTISNFTRTEASAFLARIGKWLGSNGVLLIGVDLVKPATILNAAYNDSAGITAAFNLNLLARMANELDTDINPDMFSHLAFFNVEESRIEMHLVSNQDCEIDLAGTSVQFAQGERIHTESSYKYSVEGFQAMAEQAGFKADRVWTDSEELFSVHYLSVA